MSLSTHNYGEKNMMENIRFSEESIRERIDSEELYIPPFDLMSNCLDFDWRTMKNKDLFKKFLSKVVKIPNFFKFFSICRIYIDQDLEVSHIHLSRALGILFWMKKIAEMPDVAKYRHYRVITLKFTRDPSLVNAFFEIQVPGRSRRTNIVAIRLSKVNCVESCVEVAKRQEIVRSQHILPAVLVGLSFF